MEEQNAPNSFGKESRDHISFDMMTSFVRDMNVVELVRLVHFYKNVPENHNVKRVVFNKNYCKNEYMMCYENGMWVYHARNHMLKKLQTNIINIIHLHMITLMCRYNEIEQDMLLENYNVYMRSCIGKTNELKSIFAMSLDDMFVDTTYDTTLSSSDNAKLHSNSANSEEATMKQDFVSPNPSEENGNNNIGETEYLEDNIDDDTSKVTNNGSSRKYCKKLLMKCWKVVNGKWTRLAN